MFEGALGVISGLDCIRLMNEAGIETVHPIEVISTSEEDGRFGGMLGAQALVGALTPDWIERPEHAEGEPLQEALAKCGLNSAGVLRSRLARGALPDFMEFHLAQVHGWAKERHAIGLVAGLSEELKRMNRS